MVTRFPSSLNSAALSFFSCLLAAILLSFGVTAEQRINGGTTVDISNVPYLASLRHKHNSTAPYIHRCSATIYSTHYLLTTARCVIGLKQQQIQIVAGSSYRSQNTGYVALVNAIIIHPDFDIWFIDNDLAILRLETPLTFDDWWMIASIALPTALPQAGTLATVAGWGVTLEDGSGGMEQADLLQQLNVYLMSEENCKEAYGEARISTAMLCAGDVSSSDIVVDACQGDAGSALVINGAAVGLVSWGSGCGRGGFLGVYTNLTHFKQWIGSVVVVENMYT